jgi:3-hydroxypropanoate dehydrogenase
MTNDDGHPIAKLFLEARTHKAWSDRPVEDSTLRRVYELARMAPTSANSQPMRVLFVKSREAKEKLRPALAPGNVESAMAAPVTAVVAYDTRFHTSMPKLFPARPEMEGAFAGLSPEIREFFLVQNGSLQAAYMILAARSLGLDCGPMGGFDRAKIDETFFGALHWRSILIVNLGYGVPEKLSPRDPRLDFDEACRIA